LTRALNRKIQSGVESPQAFAAYARSLQMLRPRHAALFRKMSAGIRRDVLLTGNGIFMNNLRRMGRSSGAQGRSRASSSRGSACATS